MPCCDAHASIRVRVQPELRKESVTSVPQQTDSSKLPRSTRQRSATRDQITHPAVGARGVVPAVTHVLSQPWHRQRRREQALIGAVISEPPCEAQLAPLAPHLREQRAHLCTGQGNASL